MNKIFKFIYDILSKFNESNAPELLGKVIGVLICLIPLFILIHNYNNNISNKNHSGSDEYYFACTAAQEEVKQRLKSPSSAKFPVCSEMNITNTGDKWTIIGYVEAQNSFGAMLKSDFTVKIELLGNNKYSVIYINID